jgi:hypothetical protein
MKDKQFNLPKISLRMPRFWSFRVPIGRGIYLGGGKLIIGSLSSVGIGFLLALVVVMNQGSEELVFPALGASYTAPSVIGRPITDPEFPAQRSQTLLLQFPAGIRLDVVEFVNINLGKAGLATSFEISGTSTSDLITVDEIVIRNSEFPKMSFDAGTVTLENVKIGSDADINSADLTLGTNGTVSINQINDGVTEAPIQIR